ncbi:MAG: hypothetical protein QOH00_4051, partial [Gaiellales bacterium]|nr:hypothetical protein [Gaiellales bacterium]
MTSPGARRLMAAILVLSSTWIGFATTGAAPAAQLPASTWALELPRSMLNSATPAVLRGYRAAGINAIVVRAGSLRPAALSELRRRGAAARLRVVERRRARRPARTCRALHRRTPRRACVVSARSLRAARRLSGTRGVDALAVGFRDPRSLLGARLPHRGRTLAIVRLSPGGKLDTKGWTRAISRARADARLDLAIAPAHGGRSGRAALAAVLRLLAAAGTPGAGAPGPQGLVPAAGTPPPGGGPTSPTPPPEPPPIVPSVFVATGGSDGAPCTRARPCASFDRAYRVARPGEGVEVAGGTYAPQTVDVDPSKVSATSDVVFLPAPGEPVTIDGNLEMYGSHAEFRDFKLRNVLSSPSDAAVTSNHVTFRNIDGAGFLIGPNRDISIIGGDWGPNLECTDGHTQEPTVTPLDTYPG